MKNKKLQVFVSSTYSDLKEERQAAVEAILSSGNIPAGMELFSAGDESQMTVIKRWIDESDVYLLILGGRYGSIDAKSRKSYTHLEYEYAIEQKKPLFAIVINEKALEEKIRIHGSGALEQEYPKELKSFRAEVLNNLVKFWDDKKDIKIAIHETISEFVYRKDLLGWIRTDNSINNSSLAEEIARLTKENSLLRQEIKSTKENSVSFSGTLQYENFVDLIKNEKVELDGNVVTLFEGLNILAPELAVGIYNPSTGKRKFLDKLALFRIVEEFGTDQFAFRFTIDGHTLYLKLLFGN